MRCWFVFWFEHLMLMVPRLLSAKDNKDNNDKKDNKDKKDDKDKRALSKSFKRRFKRAFERALNIKHSRKWKGRNGKESKGNGRKRN